MLRSKRRFTSEKKFPFFEPVSVILLLGPKLRFCILLILLNLLFGLYMFEKKHPQF